MANPGPPPAQVRALLLGVLLLLPATVLAGCVSTPTTELTVRRGDLIKATVTVVDDQGQVVFPEQGTGCPGGAGKQGQASGCPEVSRPYVVSDQVPATLPAGWLGASTLPPGVIDLLIGLAEGAQVQVADVKVWGQRSADLVETHPLEAGLPRVVDDAAAYGHAWNTTDLGDGTYRIMPGGEDRGAVVEAPRWCNQRFCLFTSHVTGWNETHLSIRHDAAVGDRVAVSELDTHLRVTQVTGANVTIDGNPARAGEPYTVTAEVHEIRAPPEGQRRAPSFNLTTLEGEQVSLAGYAGKPLVLEFFASWCPSCRKNTEHLSRLQATYRDSVAILAIDVDPWETREQLEGFIEANDVTWPIALDKHGDVSTAYRVGSLSTEVIISPQGAIVHVESGVADHDRVSRIVHDLLPPDHHGTDKVGEHG